MPNIINKIINCAKPIINTISLMRSRYFIDYDSLGNKIHEKYAGGTEFWYGANRNVIHAKWSDGREVWYDANGNTIHEKDSYGCEHWCEYDADGNISEHSKEIVK